MTQRSSRPRYTHTHTHSAVVSTGAAEDLLNAYRSAARVLFFCSLYYSLYYSMHPGPNTMTMRIEALQVFSFFAVNPKKEEKILQLLGQYKRRHPF